MTTLNITYLFAGLLTGLILVYLLLMTGLKKRLLAAQKEIHEQSSELRYQHNINEEQNSRLTKLNQELKESSEQLLQLHSANMALGSLKSQLENQLSDNRNLQQTLLLKNEDILKLSAEQATLQAKLKAADDKLLQQKQQVEEIQAAFYERFQQLASEILESKSRRFTEINQTNIKEILSPLQQKLNEFALKVENTHLEETKQRSALGQEIRSLVELNNRISKEANNLANALKTNVKSLGNWGELILESILENSGLEKDREYKVQPACTNSEGQLRQPDVVIYFPDNRCVIVDSKVSLNAYERYVNTENPVEQETEIKNHLLSVKQHIDGLSGKNYPALYQLQDYSLDFVLMFMPVEPAYLLAMQKDATLWNYAYQKKIILISPTNLIAILKMISSLWKQEYQNRNVQEIARLSGTMYDKFCGCLKDLETIGSSLDSAKKNYDQAIGKISEGKGNLLTTAEKIRKLGAKTSKTLPGKWLDNGDENGNLI